MTINVQESKDPFAGRQAKQRTVIRTNLRGTAMNRAIEGIPQQMPQPPHRRLHLGATKVFAHWQSGLETLWGCGQWKLRLELEPSRSLAITRLNA